jgi:hypothetical protein
MKILITALAAATTLLSFAPLAQAHNDWHRDHRSSSGVVIVLGDHHYRDHGWNHNRYAHRSDYYQHRAYYGHHHPRGYHDDWRDRRW